jgi:hypothetical protein
MSQNSGQSSGNHNNFQNYANNCAYCTYCRCPGHINSNCYKLKNKSNCIIGTSNNGGQGERIFNSNDVAFTTITMKNNLPMTCGFLIVEPVVITADPWKG